MVAPTEINVRGRAALEVKLVSGESAVTSAYATSPLKLLTPRSRGRSVWAYTSSFGGGMLAGDETRLDLYIGAETRCFLGTQASTKVYRNPKQRPCGHSTEAKLDAGSLLVFAPDPVQAFANSIYTQRQDFYLGEGAGLALVDWFSGGRTARGERWAFNRFQSRNAVWTASPALVDHRNGSRRELMFLDSLLFDSADTALGTTHRTGRFNCFAILLLIGKPLRTMAKQLLSDIAGQPVTKQGSWVASASPVRDGALLRVAGESVEDVGRELHRHLASVSGLLGDDPWARKW